MDLSEALSVSFQVLSDWRVDFVALAVIVAWAILRYVGSVYHRRARARPRPAPPLPPSAGAAQARGGRAAARSSRSEGPEEEAGSGMVE